LSLRLLTWILKLHVDVSFAPPPDDPPPLSATISKAQPRHSSKSSMYWTRWSAFADAGSRRKCGNVAELPVARAHVLTAAPGEKS